MALVGAWMHGDAVGAEALDVECHLLHIGLVLARRCAGWQFYFILTLRFVIFWNIRKNSYFCTCFSMRPSRKAAFCTAKIVRKYKTTKDFELK